MVITWNLVYKLQFHTYFKEDIKKFNLIIKYNQSCQNYIIFVIIHIYKEKHIIVIKRVDFI